ncbi:MAG: Gfo/Idh/MocA family oxidoreductase, partial [Coleofasciculus sp. C2-GNP5-27]
EQHVSALQNVPGLRLVSCASRDLSHAETFAAKYKIPAARTIGDVLSQPQADAFWVCVRCDVMASIAIDLSRLGLPLFLEKPVGLSTQETDNARNEISVPHMIGLNRRFYDVIRKGRDYVKNAGGVRAFEIQMPEDLSRLPDKHTSFTRQQWHFANSIHLVDLFRFFAGEPVDVITMNRCKDSEDRSYNALIRFKNETRGIFQAQWYAPGGWRVSLFADNLSVVFMPIETATVFRRGDKPLVLTPAAPDQQFKAGLFGQAEAFRELLKTGRLHECAADLNDYARSVKLMAR